MRTDGTAEIELEPGAGAKDFQLLLEPPFEGAGLKLFPGLVFGE